MAFWTLHGLVMTGSMFLSPLRQATTAPLELVAFTLLGSYAWAALTLPLFALARRIGSDDWASARTAVVFVGTAMTVALLVSTGVAAITSLFATETLGGTLTTPRGILVMVRYRYLNDLLACSLVLAAGLARDYFVRYRERQEEASSLRAQLERARLEVLRSQLNPHFLFNTLNAVAALVAFDPAGVRRMIAGLSSLLRHSLRGAEEPEITLEQELRLTRRYLEIMEIRYQGRLKTNIVASSEVLHALVPNLILQPLVENALKHGIGEAGGHGTVEVTARREADDLVLAVRDTGCLQPTPAAGETRRVMGGIGLANTRERLAETYGERGRLELRRLPAGGVVAEVRLPYEEAPALYATDRESGSAVSDDV